MIEVLTVDGVSFTGGGAIEMSYWGLMAKGEISSIRPGDSFTAIGYEVIDMLGIPYDMSVYRDGMLRERLPQGTGFRAIHKFVVVKSEM